MYSFKYRDHDPQIGRFWEIDPLSESYVHNSTYAFSENKVTSHIELEGLESISLKDLWRGAGITSSTEPKQYFKEIAKEQSKPQNIWNAVGGAATIVSQTVIGPALIGLMSEGILAGTAATSEVSAVKSVRTTSTSLAPELEGVPVATAETKVTEASISKALEGSTMKTTQGEVSLPMVERYVKLIESGSPAPPIKVADGGVIVDGNHRYVAGRVAGEEPTTIKGTMSPSQASRIVPIQDTKVSLDDWGGH